MTKKALRQALRQRLAEMPPEQLHAQSAAACELLMKQAEFRKAEIIMIYLATSSEVNTTNIALRAWEEGKRIVAPKVSWDQRRMLPTEIKSLTTDVREGMMGIREPVDGMPIPVSELDLIVVPGLGFDSVGNRLGRGRGFYDRFLAHRDLRGVACGLAFDAQIVEEIPFEPNDVPMRMLVTSTQARRFRR